MAASLVSSSIRRAEDYLFSHSLKRLVASVSEMYLNLLQQSSQQVCLEKSLDQIKARIDSSCVQTILHKPDMDRILVLRFFIWAGQRSYYQHSTLMYSKVSSYVEICRLSETLLEILETYKKEKINMPIKGFKVILNICRAAKLTEVSLQILRRMSEFNCLPDTVTYNIVIRLLCEKNDIDVARGLMEEMPSLGLYPDLITYVEMIKGLCAVRRLKDARAVLSEMYNQGCFPNTVVYSAIIHGACQAGDLDGALEILYAIEKGDCGCSANTVMYTSLIQSFCEKGQAIRAIEILDMMCIRGCTPNWVTLTTLINGLIAEGRLDHICDIADRFAEMEALSSDKCYSFLLVGLVRAKNMSEAEKMLTRMMRKGIIPTGTAVSTFIRELCISGRSLEGLSWCRDLLTGDTLYVVDSVIYSTLLDGLCREGHLSQAIDLAVEMFEGGIGLKYPYVKGVVEGLQNAGKAELALKLLNISKH